MSDILQTLTLQDDVRSLLCGIPELELGPQHSLPATGSAALDMETPANSGKSAIFTSNGTKFASVGLDFPAKFGADLAPLKPVGNRKA